LEGGPHEATGQGEWTFSANVAANVAADVAGWTMLPLLGPRAKMMSSSARSDRSLSQTVSSIDLSEMPVERGLRAWRPAASLARNRLRLLTAFSLSHANLDVTLGRTAQRLLAFVALHPEPVLRSYAAMMLWPDSTEKLAASNLRSALWRVHKVDKDLMRASKGTIAIGPAVAVDVSEAETMAYRALDPSFQDSEFQGWTPAIRTLSEDLLPEWYDDWVLLRRETFRQLRLHALETICDRLVAADRLAEAVQAGLRAVAAENLRESAHRSLLRAYLAEGNLGEVVRHYRWYRRLVKAELGAEPTPLIRRLVEGLRVD
jgi:DNA-binding SARP family transcriptional activator